VAVVDLGEVSIRFFNPATGGVLTNVAGQALAASQDGKQLAILSQTNVILYDAIELTEIGRMNFPSPLGGPPCFSLDGRWLAFRRADSGGPG
jgi:hypothetical protein